MQCMYHPQLEGQAEPRLQPHCSAQVDWLIYQRAHSVRSNEGIFASSE